MKRIATILLLAVLVTGLAVAQRGGGAGRFMGMHMWREGPFQREAQEILDDYEDRVPSELTFGEIDELAGRLSVPAQKAAWVGASSFASFMAPGFGQFMNKDALGGSLFALGSLAIKGGTLAGVYFLLPEEVRFDQINYWSTPKSQIKSTWETALGDMTLADSLAIGGVVAGGMLLDVIVSGLSAKHAGDLARRRIANRQIEFEPKPEIILLAPGGLGIRMAY